MPSGSILASRTRRHRCRSARRTGLTRASSPATTTCNLAAKDNAATVGYTDAWAAARARAGSITFFISKAATLLALTSAQMVDTRTRSGVMPSDHKPMLVVHEVR